MSELKRYVLLNDNTILDISKGIYDLKVSDIKKISDDLLDLVEVNDLLELDNDWEILKVIRIDKDNQPICLVRTSSNIEECVIKDYRKEHIKAIYKRQQNGDYKCYEVTAIKLTLFYK